MPGALLAAWVYRWAWFPTVGLICVVPLLYPTGTVPGPRWRFVLWGLVGLFATVTVVFMFYPGPLDDGEPPLPDNPVGIGALELPGRRRFRSSGSRSCSCSGPRRCR